MLSCHFLELFYLAIASEQPMALPTKRAELKSAFALTRFDGFPVPLSFSSGSCTLSFVRSRKLSATLPVCFPQQFVL